MTLDTRIYVHGKVDRAALFQFCQKALLTFGKDPRAVEDILTEDEPVPGFRDQEPDPNGEHWLMNKPSQSLPAWLIMYYRPDGALTTQEQYEAHDEDCEDYDDCSIAHRPPCWLKISFDTAYGYEGENGWSCGDLHAALVTVVGKYLEMQEVTWAWMNEFTGEVHQGYDNLEELGRGGRQAQDWFDTAAAPAIVAHMASLTAGSN